MPGVPRRSARNQCCTSLEMCAVPVLMLAMRVAGSVTGTQRISSTLGWPGT